MALKQKLNSIAVKCKDELRAPQEIMALVSNTVLPQNEQQRCYLECVYKGLNLVKNNKFSAADGKALALIRFANQPDEHKKAVTIIDNCTKEGMPRSALRELKHYYYYYFVPNAHVYTSKNDFRRPIQWRV